MKKPCIIILAISILFCCACKVQKNQANNTSASVRKEAQFIKDGFDKGMINYHPENKEACQWFIKLDNGKLLEPLDLPQEFKKDSLKVWLKYMDQKRPSRCMEAMPVGISDIKLRKD